MPSNSHGKYLRGFNGLSTIISIARHWCWCCDRARWVISPFAVVVVRYSRTGRDRIWGQENPDKQCKNKRMLARRVHDNTTGLVVPPWHCRLGRVVRRE